MDIHQVFSEADGKKAATLCVTAPTAWVEKIAAGTYESSALTE